MRPLPRVLLPYLAAALALETAFVVAHFRFPGSRLFDLDREYTIPAWFSALQLAAVGVSALVAFEAERAARTRVPLRWLWLPLALGFLYLSADEVLALHERVLTRELRALVPAESLLQGVLPWQIVFAPAILAAFVGVAAMVYTRFAPEPALRALGLGALGFWSLSFVLEGSAKPFFIPRDMYPLEVALEETAEMLAGTSLLAAFASYCVLRLYAPPYPAALRWKPVIVASIGSAALAAAGIAAFTVSNPAYLHRRAGDKFFEEKDYERAAVAYHQALERSPEDADIWRRLGRAELDARRLDAAREAYRRAVELAPDNPALHNDLGVVLYNAGDYEGARAAYEASIAVRPAYARAHKNLGVLYEKIDDPVRAEAAYREALRRDRRMADVHRYLGNLLARTDRVPEAAQHWRKSLEIDPKQSDAAKLRRKLQDAGQTSG
jgi:tetratricopeptide (TPR) repeat protein